MSSIVQKKGSPDHLSGRLLAYARIIPGGMPESDRNPLAEAVHNGLLIVAGDFENQANLKDFLRKEFGADFDIDEGLEHLASQIKNLEGDIPEGMNPDSLRERLDSLSHMEIIPVPARVVQFNSEEDLLAQDADIFYVGEFQGTSHAHLAVTSFPILYQAWFREQQSRLLQDEIDQILNQVEITAQTPKVIDHADDSDPAILDLPKDLTNFSGNLQDLLLGTVLPNLLYHLNNKDEFTLSWKVFIRFMHPYRRQEDIELIAVSLQALRQGDDRQNRILELLCRKISAIHHEEFEKVSMIQQELNQAHSS